MARFDYESMVQKALRGVVFESLKEVETGGLSGSHHFYITFQTDRPDVKMSQVLRDQHPEEITIVLQHQFWNLKVDPNVFSVTLSFDGRDEHLTVPIAAVTRFLDPYVKFGLEFAPDDSFGGGDDPSGLKPQEASLKNDKGEVGANVITMDQFRKK